MTDEESYALYAEGPYKLWRESTPKEFRRLLAYRRAIRAHLYTDELEVIIHKPTPVDLVFSK
jgi:hypothetical protein